MKKPQKLVLHVFLILTSVLFIFPLLWMLISMTNTSKDIIAGKILPGSYFFENLSTVFSSTDFVTAFINSTFIAVTTTVIAVILTSSAAYAFQMYANKKSEFLFNVIIVSMMIPFAALMIPLYKLTVDVGLLDTFTAIIFQGAAPVILLFFFRQTLRNFPTEMIEAARIDGAGELKIFIKLVVPSLKSTYAAASIVAFMTAWNNYLWPLLVVKSAEMKTLPLTISAMSSAHTADYGAQMIVITLSTIPMIIIFLTLQKYFVEGMVGSSK